MTVTRRSRSDSQSSISVAASSAEETSSASEQLGVARQGASQREPLHLTAGQADAAVPDDGVGSARLGHVTVEARRGQPRLGYPAGVVEQDVVAEGAREHPRHLGHMGDAAGAKLGLGVIDGRVVPPDAPGGADQTGQGAEQARLAGADLAEQQHELARLDGEVDVARAHGSVVVHGGEPVEGQPSQRLADRGRRGRSGAPHEVDAGLAGPSGRRRPRGGWWPSSTRGHLAPR